MKNENDFKGQAVAEINTEVLRHILDQAEKNLEETVKTADLLTNRAFNIIQVFALLGAGSITYLCTDIVQSKPLQILSAVGIGSSFIILFNAMLAFKLYGIRPIGHPPKSFLPNDFTLFKEPEKEIIYGTIKSIEISIGENDSTNKFREGKIKNALKISWWTLIISTMIAILFLTKIIS